MSAIYGEAIPYVEGETSAGDCGCSECKECHPLDTFDRPDIEFEFGTASSCLPWTWLADYAYVFGNEGRLDGVLVGAGGVQAGGGRRGGETRLELSSGTLAYPFDVVVSFSCDSDQNSLSLPGDQLEAQFLAIAVESAVDGNDPAHWDAFVRCGYATNPIFRLGSEERWAEYGTNGEVDFDGTGGNGETNFIANTTYTMTVHVALQPDPITYTLDGSTLSIDGLPPDSEPPTGIIVRVGSDNVTVANGGPVVVPFTTVTEVDIPQFECGECSAFSPTFTIEDNGFNLLASNASVSDSTVHMWNSPWDLGGPFNSFTGAQVELDNVFAQTDAAVLLRVTFTEVGRRGFVRVTVSNDLAGRIHGATLAPPAITSFCAFGDTGIQSEILALRANKVGSSPTVASDYECFVYEPGDYLLRIETSRVTSVEAQTRVRMWPEGEAEPGAWTVMITAATTYTLPVKLMFELFAKSDYAPGGILLEAAEPTDVSITLLDVNGCTNEIAPLVNYAHVFPPESIAGGITS